jgi:hypothetical protein
LKKKNLYERYDRLRVHITEVDAIGASSEGDRDMKSVSNQQDSKNDKLDQYFRDCYPMIDIAFLRTELVTIEKRLIFLDTQEEQILYEMDRDLMATLRDALNNDGNTTMVDNIPEIDEDGNLIPPPEQLNKGSPGDYRLLGTFLFVLFLLLGGAYIFYYYQTGLFLFYSLV